MGIGGALFALAMVFVMAFIMSGKEQKAQQKRNAAYGAQYGRAMNLMTVHGYTEKEEISRMSNGSLLGEMRFYATASKASGGQLGYIEASKYSHRFTVDKIVLSEEVQKIYATDPLYRKYAVKGTILCNNGKALTDAQLTTWSRLDSRRQEEYATTVMEQQRISHKECQEIVTLLERIQKGIFPEESRRQEANAKRTSAFLIILAILSFVFLAFFFLSM